MDEDNRNILVRLRLERATELLAEAEKLLVEGAFKSANNRAYYAIEKSLNALLAHEDVFVQTHKGCLLQFNIKFVKEGNSFTIGDYKIAANAEQIRNASDYDDFYIADKQETTKLVHDAKYLYNKIKQYIEQKEKENCRE